MKVQDTTAEGILERLWAIGIGAFVGAVWEWMLLGTFGVLLLVLCLLKFVGAA